MTSIHPPIPAAEDVMVARLARAYGVLQGVIEDDARLLSLLVENTSDIVVLGCFDTHRLFVSSAAKRILGFKPNELVGTKTVDFVHPDDRDDFADHRTIIHSGSGGDSVCRWRHRHKDGHYVRLESSARPLHDPGTGQVMGAIITMRDVSRRWEDEERIRHLALYDSLTDLPNRALFHERLIEAIRSREPTCRRLAVLACDLDRFKAVNDSFGHSAGDTLLGIVASRMSALIGPGETLARLGGDEFAIILLGPAIQDRAEHLAGRLIEALREPITVNGHSVEIGISIGLAIPAEDDRCPAEILKQADIALYEAKACGRDTFRFYDHERGALLAMRSRLSWDVRAGLMRGEFWLAYQPIIDAVSGNVLGFEALLRWQHPEKGLVSPDTFIPIAEETGGIVQLGAWVLQEACRRAVGWPACVRVAVNVSAIQLKRDGLEDNVVSALEASGLSPSRLELEVTESVLLSDADLVLARLCRLQALGVRVALDDFGTGFSSLSYLRRFPFDKVKLDRTFIADIGALESGAIVEAVVAIGRRLRMDVVAEGVETAEQLAQLQREGCTQLQGYLFSRPMPGEQTEGYVSGALSQRVVYAPRRLPWAYEAV